MLMMYQLEQAVPGEPEQDDEATINVKQSDNETFQNSNTDEELPSVVDFYENNVNDKEISPFIHTCTLNVTLKH